MGKYRFRKWLALGLLMLTFAPLAFMSPPPVKAGAQTLQRFVLFAGADTDSNVQVSKWIPVRGAQRIVLRTFTSTLGFGANADSLKSDSLQTIEFAFSDSVLFFARDSAGTMVTARSGIPVTSSHGEPYPVCVDSTITAINTIGDSTHKHVSVIGYPLAKPLRGATSGWGTYTYIYPRIWGAQTGVSNDSRSVIMAGFMRVRATPLRRPTLTRWASTSGGQVNGLRGFKMEAWVYTDNK